MRYSTPAEFHAYWMGRIERNEQIGDDDLREMFRYRESDSVVSAAIGALACRGMLSPAQTKRLLEKLPPRFPNNDHAYNQVLALTIVRDGLRNPSSKLAALLRMGCDWACALVISDFGPYHCGQAFDIINRSRRPAHIRSQLCAAVAAHQKAMWAEIKTL
jgi:hypothetical protein